MRVFFRLVSVLCLGLPLLYSLFGQTVTAATTFETLTDVGSLPISAPATDGHYVVWFDSQSSLHVAAIQNGTFAKPQAYSVKGNPITNTLKTDGGYAVWSDKEEDGDYVYSFNLASGQQTLVGKGDNPSISMHSVAYISPSVTTTVALLRDLSTMSAPVTIPDAVQVMSLALDEYSGEIAWTHPWDYGNGNITNILYTENVNNLNGSTYWGIQGTPITVTQYYKGTLVYNVKSGFNSTELYALSRGNPPSFGADNATNTTTDGRYVFWNDYITNTQQSTVIGLHGYDSKSQISFDIATNQSISVAPSVANGYVIWGSGNISSSGAIDLSQINLAPIASVLPNAPVNAVANTANSTYFTETQHTLSFGFKYFWEHNGALPVFGYPLTEEYQEPNLDNGGVYTVQYFERERFEYHPEFKGTPYETELGLLGIDDANQRKLTFNKTFQPAANNHQAGCTYFPQTQHNVCGDFASYWSSHGLDFGDTGTTFRESLALFGYPISEPFTDPQTGLTVQYFERARFEYHPEFKGTPNVVELGQLGKAALQAKGWQ